MTAIRLRFVHGSGLESGAIEIREGTCMPFTPSHVECVTPAGKYLGQHAEGGMQAREPGYDGVGPKDEMFLDLPCTQAQHDAFYAGADAAIGEPYDWGCIPGFAIPGHHHTKFHAICSAKIELLLRTKGCEWFPSKLPLCVPAHCIDPRDLLLVLSSIIEVPH